MKLSEIKVNEKAKIISICGDDAYKLRLNNIGVKVGGEVKILRISPLLDLLEIEVNNSITIAIRKKSADNIEVEIIE
ncbi:MAG: ferrous iron transport protein A [Firmicutes bacterium]|nr:ferrous iron transport protein A [Candidatus Caballimonas caccae]